MRRTLICFLVVLVSMGCAATFAEEKDEKKIGIGGGVIGGVIDADGADRENVSGVHVFARMNFAEHWGFLVSVRHLQGSDDLKFSAFSLNGYRGWLTKKVWRPYVRLGAAFVDLQTRIPEPILSGLRKESDRDLAVQAGAGFEVGGSTLAMVLDANSTFVELFNNQNYKIGEATLALVYKF